MTEEKKMRVKPKFKVNDKVLVVNGFMRGTHGQVTGYDRFFFPIFSAFRVTFKEGKIVKSVWVRPKHLCLDN